MKPSESWPISAAAERIRKRRRKRTQELEERRKRAQEWAIHIATVLDGTRP